MQMPPRADERLNNHVQSLRRRSSSGLSHKKYQEDEERERGRLRNAGTVVKQPNGSRSNSNGVSNQIGSKQYSITEKVQMLSEKIQSRLALSRDSRGQSE